MRTRATGPIINSSKAAYREMLDDLVEEAAERIRAFRCSCQIADHVSGECLMRGKCKERAIGSCGGMEQ